MALKTALPASTLLWRGWALAAIAAVLFSGKAILAKFIYRHGVDALDLITLRLLFALPFFIVLAYWTGRGRAPLARADLLRLSLLGLLGYYLSSLLDFMGLQHISVGLERLILFLGPAIVLLLGHWFFARPARRGQWLSMAIAYAGVALVFVHDFNHQPGRVWLGALLVLGAALSYSLYLLNAGDLVQRLGTLRLVAWAMLVSTVLCAMHYVLLRAPADLLVMPPPVYGWSILNAVFCTVIPVICTMKAVAMIGPGSVAQAGMLGPLSLLPLGYVFLGDPVTLIQLTGTALVLIGISLLVRESTLPRKAAA
jgi:drug/metabolite transporter (DMT)-like permease